MASGATGKPATSRHSYCSSSSCRSVPWNIVTPSLPRHIDLACRFKRCRRTKQWNDNARCWRKRAKIIRSARECHETLCHYRFCRRRAHRYKHFLPRWSTNTWLWPALGDGNKGCDRTARFCPAVCLPEKAANRDLAMITIMTTY